MSCVLSSIYKSAHLTAMVYQSKIPTQVVTDRHHTTIEVYQWILGIINNARMLGKGIYHDRELHALLSSEL